MSQVVDRFNHRFPVGTEVILRKDSGPIRTKVRGEAQMLSGVPVAFFVGVSGAYAIDGRVRSFIAAVTESRDRCPGGDRCTCCSSNCDCGCRDECPRFLSKIIQEAF